MLLNDIISILEFGFKMINTQNIQGGDTTMKKKKEKNVPGQNRTAP